MLDNRPEIEKILKLVAEIDGVQSTIVFDHQGKVLAHVHPELIDDSLTEEAISSFFITISPLQSKDEFISMETRCSNGRMFVKKLPNAFLPVSVTNTTDMSQLQTVINLAVKRISKILERSDIENKPDELQFNIN